MLTFSFYFFIFYWLCYYSCPILFSPLFPSTLHHPSHQHSPPPQFMSMGHTYKFFGFSISYTIFNLLLSILYLPFMLLIPCILSPILPYPLPTDNPPSDLHFCDSVPVLVICLVWFFVWLFVWLFLGSIVDSYKFVVILLFIILIIFFLDTSL